MKFIDQYGSAHDINEKETEVTWRISAYGVVQNNDGKLLMLMPHFNKQWQFPGGQIEINETISEAIVREFGEEVGYKVEADLSKLLYFNEANFFDSYSGKCYHSMQLTFACKLVDENLDEKLVMREEEMDYGEMGWIDPQTLTKENVQHTHWPIIPLLVGPSFLKSE